GEYMITDSSMIIYAKLERRRFNILMSINASIVIFYVFGGSSRCSAKDENDPRGTGFDFRVKMEFPFEINEILSHRPTISRISSPGLRSCSSNTLVICCLGFMIISS
ncbi:Odorant receptor 421, partial [Nylanderia fulva]